MAWIESHQELGQHPKTKRLARALQISLPAAVGHLHFLWWWALNYAQDGDLSKYTDEDIADAICWDGNAVQAVDALVKSGFIDEEPDGVYSIHKWHEYAGRLIEQRKAQTEYKQRQYALYNDLRLTRAIKNRDGDICRYCGKTVNWNDRRGIDGGTYDHINPDGDNTIENIVVCCRSCSSKKGGKTPKQAGMTFVSGGYEFDTGRNTVDNSAGNLQLHNPTIPNNTLHNNDIKDHPPTPRKRGKRTQVQEPPKTQYAEFVSMTNDEHTSLVSKYGEKGTARCIEILDNYKGANGRKYTSDYRAILNWVVKRLDEEQRTQGRPPPGYEPEQGDPFLNNARRYYDALRSDDP